MSKFTQVAPIDVDTHPGFVRLFGKEGFQKMGEENVDALLAARGLQIVAFADDPMKQKETLDIVVIAPELRRALGDAVAGAWFTDVRTGRALAARWGIRKLPAVALFRSGTYLGAAEGLLGWDEYLRTLAEIGTRTEAPPRRISLIPNNEPPTCG